MTEPNSKSHLRLEENVSPYGFFDERNYLGIFKQVPEAIILLDNDHRVVDANNAFENMLGYSREEVLATNFIKLIGAPDSKWFSDKVNVLSYGDSDRFEIAHFHKNGNILTLEAILKKIDIENSNYLIIIYDFFSRQNLYKEALLESERKYRNIIENLNDIYYRTDVKGNLIIVSPSCLETFGYSSLDEVKGQSIELLYPRQEERNEFLAELKKTGRIKNYRTKLLKKDGSEIYVETTSNVLLDNQGNYIGVEGIVRDITDRMLAEQALRESEKNLKELNATKDKLFSIIAHDLKSPFTSILGFSGLLTESFESLNVGEIKDFVKHIDNSAKNTLYLLENLLNWAKSQTGQLVYYPDNLNLQQLIQIEINILSSAAKIKNITINFDTTSEVFVFSDQNMLQTVIRNLISNAIKFTYPGGIIDIFVESGRGMAQIRVSDNGMGMERQILESLFSLDKNFTSKGTAQESGTGLGLVICKEFIEKNSGQIWVESEPGKGSKFYITLPLAL